MDYRSEHQEASRAASYDKGFDSGYDGYVWTGPEAKIIRRVLATRNGSERHADLACGTGRVAGLAARFTDHVDGFDVSPAMLALARRRTEHLGNVQFHSIDLTEVERLQWSYDSVSAFRLFLNADDHIRRAVARVAHASLKDGGILVANIHCVRPSPVALLYALDRRFRRIARRPPDRLRNSMSVAALKTILSEVGFAEFEVVYYGYFPRLPWLANRTPMPILRVADFVGGTLWKRPGAQLAILVATKAS